MKFDVAIKGWVGIEAESEEAAKAKAKEITDWLHADAVDGGYSGLEGTFFEEVGIEPVDETLVKAS